MNIKRSNQTTERLSSVSPTKIDRDPLKIPSTTPANLVWSLKIRVLVSFLVGFHLLAVFAEPFRFFSRTPETFAAADAAVLRSTIGPYVDMMYLSHGYFFFAPNPGPAHLIECQISPETADQKVNLLLKNEVTRRTYPDRKEQWPRLLYHRHFMLSEFYNTLFAPTELEDPASLGPEVITQWREDRKVYELLQESIKANLSQKYPVNRIVLKRIQHELPNPRLVFRDRWKLTDPRLYGELLEGPVQDPVEDPTKDTKEARLETSDGITPEVIAPKTELDSAGVNP